MTSYAFIHNTLAALYLQIQELRKRDIPSHHFFILLFGEDSPAQRVRTGSFHSLATLLESAFAFWFKCQKKLIDTAAVDDALGARGCDSFQNSLSKCAREQRSRRSRKSI